MKYLFSYLETTLGTGSHPLLFMRILFPLIILSLSYVIIFFL